jgi:hypothetical protein
MIFASMNKTHTTIEKTILSSRTKSLSKLEMAHEEEKPTLEVGKSPRKERPLTAKASRPDTF